MGRRSSPTMPYSGARFRSLDCAVSRPSWRHTSASVVGGLDRRCGYEPRKESRRQNTATTLAPLPDKVLPLKVTAHAAEIQMTIAKNTVHGEMMQLRQPQSIFAHAINSYVPKAMTMKTMMTTIEATSAGHTTPLRTPSVVPTASDTDCT